MLADKQRAAAELRRRADAQPAPQRRPPNAWRGGCRALADGEQAPARTCDRRAGPGDRRRRAGRDRALRAGAAIGPAPSARPARRRSPSPRAPEQLPRRAGGVILPAHDRAGPGHWRRLLRRAPGDAALSPLYGPLLAAPTAADGCYVLGRIAQSLDGRIATASGASHWISGQEDIVHTHRLRALFDAVVVGAGTVRADDPQLTTREVEGPSPVRVVLDTDRRLDARLSRVPRGAGDAAALRRRCARRGSRRQRAGAAPAACRRGTGHRRRARGAGRARTAAHVRRGRRHHRVALPRRRRARPAARHDRAAADRLRHSRLHAAAKCRR